MPVKNLQVVCPAMPQQAAYHSSTQRALLQAQSVQDWFAVLFNMLQTQQPAASMGLDCQAPHRSQSLPAAIRELPSGNNGIDGINVDQ